jgi:hypothetical protein
MGFDGFDSVELVMDLEDLFSIPIPDRDAERLQTADELRSYLVGRVHAEPGPRDAPCASAGAFYRTRRALSELLGIDAADLRPSTVLRPLLPAGTEDRRDLCRSLTDRLGLPQDNFQATDRKVAAAAVCGVSVVAMVFVIIAAASSTLPAQTRYVAAGSVAALLAWMIVSAVRSWRDAYGLGSLTISSLHTVGDLSGALFIQGTLAHLSAKRGGWTDRDVWSAVQCLTAKSADIAPSRIRRGTRFDSLL